MSFSLAKTQHCLPPGPLQSQNNKTRKKRKILLWTGIDLGQIWKGKSKKIIVLLLEGFQIQIFVAVILQI